MFGLTTAEVSEVASGGSNGRGLKGGSRICRFRAFGSGKVARVSGGGLAEFGTWLAVRGGLVGVRGG